MSTKTLHLLVLISLLISSLTIASTPMQGIDPCTGSGKIDKFLSAVRWAKIDDRLPKSVLSFAGRDLFVGPVSVEVEINTWLASKELGIASRSELIQNLEAAGWKKVGTHWEGGDYWNKPKDWQDPCKDQNPQNPSGGNGGNSAPQHTFNRILWLIIFAILAMLAVGTIGRKLVTA